MVINAYQWFVGQTKRLMIFSEALAKNSVPNDHR